MSPWVANCFVYGDSSTTFLVGVVVPDWEVVDEWAASHGVKGDHVALCGNAKLVSLMRLDMERVARKEQLIGFEKVRRFKLFHDEFGVDNGLLTATMKLKRHQAKLFFKKDIEALYREVATSKL